MTETDFNNYLLAADNLQNADSFFKVKPLIELQVERIRQKIIHYKPERKLEYLTDLINKNFSINQSLPCFIDKHFSDGINSKIENIRKDIINSGGQFQYWQKNKSKFSWIEDIDYYYFSGIKYLSMISDLYDEIYQYECDTPTSQTIGETGEKREQKKEFSPLEKKLLWTGKGDITEHLEKLKSAGIISNENIKGIINLEEKINMKFDNTSIACDWARSLFEYWCDNSFTAWREKKNIHGYKKRHAETFTEIFDKTNLKKFSEYVPEYIENFQKILE